LLLYDELNALLAAGEALAHLQSCESAVAEQPVNFLDT
jgi:hypothetical protein